MLDRGSAQPSSPRASSSSGARQPTAPSYLSARSADVILSEVRPTRIKNEALRSVNVLLDELLWLIVGCARSFAPDRLRSGLLKILPTSLGKGALLEAEVELRAYIERNPPATPLPTDEPTIQKFPLQPAFELLRLKCEAYSSLGDQQDNPESEEALHARMVQIAGDTTPKPSAVAPAALYLTAILEHICEHVLSNVGRVVARDSSRATAHAQDLYVALCEDEAIYSLFKTMKVHEQIEQQSKMTRPRRSTSFSRKNPNVEISSPGPSPAVPKPRQSLDSTVSNGSNTNLANRTSTDNKNRNKGDSRTVHRRSNSLLGEKGSLLPPDDGSKAEAAVDMSPTDDDASMQDFDDLMRSGTTMKVSLTPDRLKTFEVFAKEKNQRGNRSPYLPPSPSGRDNTSAPPSSFPNGAAHLVHKSQSAKTRIPVESIAETPEDGVRPRAASITSPPIPRDDKPPFNSRSRSFTDTRATTTGAESFTPIFNNKSSDDSDVLSSSTSTMPVAVVDPVTGMPKRTRPTPARNPESLDLDELMDASEDDMPIVKKTSLTPKSAQATASGTRDLMDFLSEGPPEPPAVPPHSPSPTITDSQRAKHGRFRTIVSRLTGSSSNERLTPRHGDDAMDPLHRSSTVGTSGASTPQRQPPSLHAKRSSPNVAVAARPIPVSSPSPPSNRQENTLSPPGLRYRQLSMTRKAVPPWDPSSGAQKAEIDSSIAAKPPAKSPEDTGPPRPLPKSPTGPPQSTESVGALSNRKPPPRELDKPKDSTEVKPPSSSHSNLPTNGHAKAEQDAVKPAPRVPLRSDRRVVAQGLTLSIPAEEHIGDLRRMMARATSADECRVLVDMFLAKCGVLPGDETPGPITPVSPIRADLETRHESNLVEILLGDGLEPSVHSAPAISDPVLTSTGHLTPRSVEPIDRRSPQPRASPVLTPAPSPSPVVATTA